MRPVRVGNGEAYRIRVKHIRRYKDKQPSAQWKLNESNFRIHLPLWIGVFWIFLFASIILRVRWRWNFPKQLCTHFEWIWMIWRGNPIYFLHFFSSRLPRIRFWYQFNYDVIKCISFMCAILQWTERAFKNHKGFFFVLSVCKKYECKTTFRNHEWDNNRRNVSKASIRWRNLALQWQKSIFFAFNNIS